MLAGHAGDTDAARAAWADPDGRVREAALGALERCGALDDATLGAALVDPEPLVRRRAAELAAKHPDVPLLAVLGDADPDVVEVAAWACGEQLETSDDPDLSVVDRLAELASGHDAPLVREAAAAALGAIGHDAGLPAILAACDDKPQIRRRAVLALAPFDGPEVEAAIERALTDRDWQVRQAAEDLRRAAGQLDT
ncbi:MAG: HEAT repeat domain-containing protein [Ilumatobacteraceae bacterium]